MEFREYLVILGRRWWILLIMILIFGFGFYALGKNKPTTYQGIASITVLKKPDTPEPQSTAYQFDQFYNLQTSQTLSEMIAGWVADPTMVARIYGAASLPLPEVSLESLRTLISVRVNNRSSIEFIAPTDTESKASKLVTAAVQIVKEQLLELEKEEVLSDLVILEGKPLVQPKNPNPQLYLTIGIALGVLIGIMSAFLLESLLEKKR